MHGRIVHFEVPFDVGDRARNFYQKAFGWNLAPMPELDYTIVSTGPVTDEGMPSESGFINGGMFERGSDRPPSGPVVVINVESIDDSLKQVGELGGAALTGRAPVGDMGFAAYFKDTEGNIMGLWESA